MTSTTMFVRACSAVMLPPRYVRSSVKTDHVRTCSRDCLCPWLMLKFLSYFFGKMEFMLGHDSVTFLPYDSTYSRWTDRRRICSFIRLYTSHAKAPIIAHVLISTPFRLPWMLGNAPNWLYPGLISHTLSRTALKYYSHFRGILEMSSMSISYPTIHKARLSIT